MRRYSSCHEAETCTIPCIYTQLGYRKVPILHITYYTPGTDRRRSADDSLDAKAAICEIQSQY